MGSLQRHLQLAPPNLLVALSTAWHLHSLSGVQQHLLSFVLSKRVRLNCNILVATILMGSLMYAGVLMACTGPTMFVPAWEGQPPLRWSTTAKSGKWLQAKGKGVTVP
jgi:hypothetical protein